MALCGSVSQVLVEFGRVSQDPIGFGRMWQDVAGFGRIWKDLGFVPASSSSATLDP